MTDPDALVGVAEIAEALGLSKQSVSNWKRRDPSFPAPTLLLRMGPIWRLGPILNWWSAKRAARQAAP